jgi:aspartate aminotransferase-like enzyme
MKHRLMTPGPTPVPEETLLELARPVFFHRSAEFKKILAEVLADLQYVFCTKNPVLPLTCSGTGGMEAALANCVPAGGKVICLISGRWGERFRNISNAHRFEVVSVTVPYGQAVRPEQLADALQQHPDVDAVCATLSETATGVHNPIEAFGKLVAPTPALFIVDAISGLGVVECRTDDWNIDVCVTGSQKALMLPPGLAFVAVSDKAWRKIENNDARLFYFDLKKYRAKLKDPDTPFTPANTLVRALRVSLKKLCEEGIENVWARHARVAAACRAGAQAMGLELFAQSPVDGLTVIKVPAGVDGVELVSRLEKRYGVRVAGGQDTLKGQIIRIAHMGYLDQFDVLSALSALELVLLEMGHPVEPGKGVAAAQRSLAESLSSRAGTR